VQRETSSRHRDINKNDSECKRIFPRMLINKTRSVPFGTNGRSYWMETDARRRDEEARFL